MAKLDAISLLAADFPEPYTSQIYGCLASQLPEEPPRPRAQSPQFPPDQHLTSNKMKLLPCPFCGSEPEIVRGGTARQSSIILCADCGTRVEANESEATTGNKWNTRTPPEAVIAELRDVLTKISLHKQCDGPDCHWCESGEHPPSAEATLAQKALDSTTLGQGWKSPTEWEALLRAQSEHYQIITVQKGK